MTWLLKPTLVALLFIWQRSLFPPHTPLHLPQMAPFFASFHDVSHAIPTYSSKLCQMSCLCLFHIPPCIIKGQVAPLHPNYQFHPTFNIGSNTQQTSSLSIHTKFSQRRMIKPMVLCNVCKVCWWAVAETSMLDVDPAKRASWY